jgi:DNA-binding MarR family transcriptional regulator
MHVTPSRLGSTSEPGCIARVDSLIIGVYTLIVVAEADITMATCQHVARQCACFNLRKASRAVTQLYDDALRETGLRVTQLTLLVATYLRGEVAISRMAEDLVMDRTTLTRNLKPLEAQRLVTIRAGADRREKLVKLTGLGTTKLASAFLPWERAQRRVIEGLGTSRFDSMLKDLSKTVSLTQA